MFLALIIIRNIAPPIAMFVESHSARPKNSVLKQDCNSSWTLDQLKLGKWEIIFYRAFIFSSSFSASNQSKQLQKLAQIFGYCGLFVLNNGNTKIIFNISLRKLIICCPQDLYTANIACGNLWINGIHDSI